MSNNPVFIPLQAKSDKQSVCSMLGVSPSTVRRLLKRDATFPRPLKVSGNCYRFKISEVLEWSQSKTDQVKTAQAQA